MPSWRHSDIALEDASDASVDFPLPDDVLNEATDSANDDIVPGAPVVMYTEGQQPWNSDVSRVNLL
jgi:hypothetical protein